MDKANLAHCHYLMGLSAIGINDRKRALKNLKKFFELMVIIRWQKYTKKDFEKSFGHI